MKNQLILHIPHSSDIIPDKSGYVVDDAKLAAEKLLLTDWHTEDLFYHTDSISIVTPFNRIFCDVERFPNDADEIMSSVGMGVTYQKNDDGSDLRNVSAKIKAEILNKYYYPHHKLLKEAVNRQLLTNGGALIIDCHSFSNKPFKRDLNQSQPRPDICIGTDSYHTPPGLIKFSETYFRLAGYSVMINNPYLGSIVPMEYYQKDIRVQSIMIEINRDLYLIPSTNMSNKNYIKIKRHIKNYLDKVNTVDYCYEAPIESLPETD